MWEREDGEHTGSPTRAGDVSLQAVEMLDSVLKALGDTAHSKAADSLSAVEVVMLGDDEDSEPDMGHSKAMETPSHTEAAAALSRTAANVAAAAVAARTAAFLAARLRLAALACTSSPSTSTAALLV